MSVASFDTLTAARTLEAAGLSGSQAAAVVETVRVAVIEGVATKADVAGLRTEVAPEISGLRAEMKSEFSDVRAEIAELRAETKSEFSDVRAEIADVRAEMKSEFSDVRAEMKSEFSDVRAEIADVRAEMAKLEMRMIRTIYGVAAALLTGQVATVFVLLRLLG